MLSEDRAVAVGNVNKDLVKLGCAQFFELCEWTDGQTYHNTLHPFRGQTNECNVSVSCMLLIVSKYFL